MIHAYPLFIDGRPVIAIDVRLPKTNLLVVTTKIGYIMCGALDIQLLNRRLSDRKIIAGRAVGVKTIEELVTAPLESVTITAEEIGIKPGMTGKEALRVMLKYERED